MVHTVITLGSHTKITLGSLMYRVNVGIKTHKRNRSGSKLIVAHTMITLESHHTSIFQVRHRNQYVIEDLEIGHETGKLIVSHTVITIEPHHTSIFQCRRRNHYTIEFFDIMLEIGKLIVSHTVITIESHHTHILLPRQGNPYNIRNHPRVICSGSHIFAMF